MGSLLEAWKVDPVQRALPLHDQPPRQGDRPAAGRVQRLGARGRRPQGAALSLTVFERGVVVAVVAVIALALVLDRQKPYREPRALSPAPASLTASQLERIALPG